MHLFLVFPLKQLTKLYRTETCFHLTRNLEVDGQSALLMNTTYIVFS